MFRSLNRERARMTGFLSVVCVALGCSSPAEWEEKPGNLELFASPLTPEAGSSMVLGLRAMNVGPVQVYQGDELIATFLNVDLKELKTYTVQAVSTKRPRAVGVAYDFERVEVNAAEFKGAVPEPEPEPQPEPEPAIEDCPGLVEVTDNRCSDAGEEMVRLQLYNNSESPLSVYESTPAVSDPAQCVAELRALIPMEESRELELLAGTVLRVVADRSAATVRHVQVPVVEQCDIVVE